MKRLISTLLAAAMVLTLALGGAGVAFADETATVTASDVDLQLSVIYTQLSKLKQDDSENTWYYSVTDLDHDGNLEFVAASLHPQDRSTNLRVWELGADRQTLTECKLAKDEDESFPDIMTDVADTYHNAETDTWSYLFYDNIVISDTEVYTIKTGVNLKDGVIDYDAFAVQHTVADPANRSVSFTDANGIAISAEQYNAAGNNAFAGAARSSTNFEWLTVKDLDMLTRLIDSYAVFSGAKEPTEVFPVPRPAALGGATAETPKPAEATPTPTPAPQPKPVEEPKYLIVTKNPTNENRKVGSTALFVACANAFESLNWTLVSPNGGEYSVPSFRSYFGADVSGEYSTTLAIADVSRDMNGWGAYCTFYYKGQTARTTTAYISVKGEPAPTPATPDGGTYYGTLVDWNTAYIRVNLDGTTEVGLPWDIVTYSGDLYVGAPATVTWSGTTTKGLNFTSCYITGRESQPVPVPEGGTFYGSVTDWNYSTVSVNLDGTTVVAIPWDIVEMNGDIYVGAPATVTWSGTTTKGLNYTFCIIDGRQPAPQPIYSSMSGTAYEAGGGFYLYLRDGSEMYIDGWKCNVSGTFYEGASCLAFFTEPLTPDSVYQVDIYGDTYVQPEPYVEPEPYYEPTYVVPEDEPTYVEPEVGPYSDPAYEEPTAAPYVPYYGTIDGRAFDNMDGRVVIYLDNGDMIYVSRDICNFYGELVIAGGGNPCTAYYTDIPTLEGIYSIDVFPAENTGL